MSPSQEHLELAQPSTSKLNGRDDTSPLSLPELHDSTSPQTSASPDGDTAGYKLRPKFSLPPLPYDKSTDSLYMSRTEIAITAPLISLLSKPILLPTLDSFTSFNSDMLNHQQHQASTTVDGTSVKDNVHVGPEDELKLSRDLQEFYNENVNQFVNDSNESIKN